MMQTQGNHRSVDAPSTQKDVRPSVATAPSPRELLERYRQRPDVTPEERKYAAIIATALTSHDFPLVFGRGQLLGFDNFYDIARYGPTPHAEQLTCTTREMDSLFGQRSPTQGCRADCLLWNVFSVGDQYLLLNTSDSLHPRSEYLVRNPNKLDGREAKEEFLSVVAERIVGTRSWYIVPQSAVIGDTLIEYLKHTPKQQPVPRSIVQLAHAMGRDNPEIMALFMTSLMRHPLESVRGLALAAMGTDSISYQYQKLSAHDKDAVVDAFFATSSKHVRAHGAALIGDMKLPDRYLDQCAKFLKNNPWRDYTAGKILKAATSSWPHEPRLVKICENIILSAEALSDKHFQSDVITAALYVARNNPDHKALERLQMLVEQKSDSCGLRRNFDDHPLAEVMMRSHDPMLIARAMKGLQRSISEDPFMNTTLNTLKIEATYAIGTWLSPRQETEQQKAMRYIKACLKHVIYGHSLSDITACFLKAGDTDGLALAETYARRHGRREELREGYRLAKVEPPSDLLW